MVTIHTLLSLAAILAGIPAMRDLLRSLSRSAAINAFLVLAILTSVTGFFLPFSSITPAVIIGILALVILAIVVLAQRVGLDLLAGRLAFVGGMVVSLYLLVFVGVVQAFLKIGPLHALAPNGSEPPFLIAQIATLLLFIGLGVIAARAFHPASRPLAAA